MMQMKETAKPRKGRVTSALQKRYNLVFKIAVSAVATMISSSNVGFLSPSVFLLRRKEQTNNVPAIETLRNSHHRVVYLYSNDTMPITLKEVRKNTSWTTIRYSESYIDSLCNEFYSSETSVAYTDTCVPMASWQVQTYPTCNTIHELDLNSGMILNAIKESSVNEKAKLIGKGGSRLVFRIFHGNKPGNFTYEVALKVSRFDREFDPISYENQRVDAIASERLTAAPDVMDIHGFCALSALNELSSGFDVRQLVKSLSFWDPLEIVEMILQASTSLVRVHSIDYEGTVNATLVHNDITHNNYVVSNRGILKLSDFNLSVLLRWNITSNNGCGFLQRRFGGAGGIHVVSLQ
jgi:predicted Ser/Thr protein kinase